MLADKEDSLAGILLAELSSSYKRRVTVWKPDIFIPVEGIDIIKSRGIVIQLPFARILNTPSDIKFSTTVSRTLFKYVLDFSSASSYVLKKIVRVNFKQI